MSVGIIGAGRMGRVLAGILAQQHTLYLFDRDETKLRQVAGETGAVAAESLEDIVRQQRVILAVPDREVISCIKALNEQKQPVQVIHIATNVTQRVVEQMQASHVQCIGAKIIGHADEMTMGQRPVIIVNEQPASLVAIAEELFSSVGQVIRGNADIVAVINTIVAEKVLEAAVHIEDALHSQDIKDPLILQSAIKQVGAGILKAYADGNLGPFAREVVQSVKAKRSRQELSSR